MMILFTATVLALTCCNLINAQNIGSDNVKKKHHFQMSIGAPAMYSGLTYEYSINHTSRVSILPRTGLGFNIFKPSLGKEFNIHSGITMLYGNKSSKLELGLGVIHYFMANYNLEMEKNRLKYNPILYGLIGYRYEFKINPLTLKFGVTPILVFNKDRNVFLPLAEIGFGFRL